MARELKASRKVGFLLDEIRRMEREIVAVMIGMFGVSAKGRPGVIQGFPGTAGPAWAIPAADLAFYAYRDLARTGVAADLGRRKGDQRRGDQREQDEDAHERDRTRDRGVPPSPFSLAFEDTLHQPPPGPLGRGSSASRANNTWSRHSPLILR